MMNERDVVALLEIAEQIGVGVWIDGGWGIDALFGYQTRPHNDIDIFIEKKCADIFVNMLTSEGYQEAKTEYTTTDHTVWKDASDRIIDLHLFGFIDEETLNYGGEAYPSNILNGKGTIGGIDVRCMTAGAQIQFHQGYEHSDKDIHDVLLLCKTFGFPVPEGFSDA